MMFFKIVGEDNKRQKARRFKDNSVDALNAPVRRETVIGTKMRNRERWRKMKQENYFCYLPSPNLGK